MQIIVDGIIYGTQSTGGISRIFSEILPRICSLDKTIEMTIFATGSLLQKPPEHRHISYSKIPAINPYLRRAMRLLKMEEQVNHALRNLCLGKGKGKTWHSTYFTLPQTWEGLQVVTMHDMIYERFPNLFTGAASDQFRELRKRCIIAADAVLCVSEATCRDVQQIYNLNPDRLHIVHNGYSDVFRPSAGNNPSIDKSADPPFFLYVGSRAHYKNFGSLINAYSRWNERKKVRLKVVGPSWRPDEQQQLAELGIQDQVDLSVDVQDEALCALYNQALAFIYPSLYEGFGIPLLEAMACGCPVIASPIASTIEVAGTCPIYFELHKEDSLIEAFSKSLSEGRHSFRVQTGIERVKHFSWDNTARGTLNVYRSIASLPAIGY